MNKREKGVTTTSVIIYIIAILFVISVLSVISTYFSKQIKATLVKNQSAQTYTTFVSYFIQDIEENGNSVKEVNTEEKEENGDINEINYILFSNGNKYSFSKRTSSIYKNNIKICENVDYCEFLKSQYGDNKIRIRVEFVAGTFEKTGNNAITFYM